MYAWGNPMSDSTRMIAPDPRRPSRPNADLHFYRADLTPGQEGVAGADPETGNRFINEIHYATYFARRLSDTLAMSKLEIGVIEDRDAQTAFTFSPTDSRWHGFVTTHRLSLDEARTALSRR